VLIEQYETFSQNYLEYVQMVDSRKPFQKEEHLQQNRKDFLGLVFKKTVKFKPSAQTSDARP
jgi:hypothetical protein